MAAITIKCPECGGDRTICNGSNQYTCQYCGARFVNASETVIPPVESAQPKANCPYCGGEIILGAQKCRHCGEWIIRRPSAQPTYVQSEQLPPSTSKSKVVAALLAFFLGGLGIHEFYLGKNGAGVAFILATICTSWMIWPWFIIGIMCLIQSISYLCMSDQEFAEKYN